MLIKGKVKPTEKYIANEMKPYTSKTPQMKQEGQKTFKRQKPRKSKANKIVIVEQEDEQASS